MEKFYRAPLASQVLVLANGQYRIICPMIAVSYAGIGYLQSLSMRLDRGVIFVSLQGPLATVSSVRCIPPKLEDMWQT